MTPASHVSPQLAWLAGLFSMLAVFLYFSRSHSLRGAFLLALLWGKIVAGVFWVLRIDVPVFTVYRYVKSYGYYPMFTVSANMLIFLSFLATTLVTLAWPEIEKELGMRGLDLLGGSRRSRR